MVDLDAARTGEAHNRGLIAAVCAAVDVPVQAGGGVRSVDAAAALADVGVARVVMGTAAVQDPALVDAVAARQPVALGLDVRGREVSIKGWTEGSGLDIADAVARLDDSGAAAVVVTQIDGEGLLGGPDLAGLAELLDAHRARRDRQRRGRRPRPPRRSSRPSTSAAVASAGSSSARRSTRAGSTSPLRWPPLR